MLKTENKNVLSRSEVRKWLPEPLLLRVLRLLAGERG